MKISRKLYGFHTQSGIQRFIHTYMLVHNFEHMADRKNIWKSQQDAMIMESAVASIVLKMSQLRRLLVIIMAE